MDFTSQVQSFRKDISLVFRIPDLVIGVFNHSSERRTAVEQRQSFYKEKMIPSLSEIEQKEKSNGYHLASF